MNALVAGACGLLVAGSAAALEPWDGKHVDRRLNALAKEIMPSVVFLQGGTSIGSGYLIDPRGYIITNNHVAQDAMTVPAADGRPAVKVMSVRSSEPERPDGPPRPFVAPGQDGRIDPARLGDYAEVVLTFEGRDLALLRVLSTATWRPLALGADADIPIGHLVAAFGAPFGRGGTMTSGIVSSDGAVRRPDQFPDMDQETRVFQTQAALNPGNSGGPVVDVRGGRVVGTVFGGSGPTNTGVNFFIAVSEVDALWRASAGSVTKLEARLDAAYVAGMKARVASALEKAFKVLKSEPVTEASHAPR